MLAVCSTEPCFRMPKFSISTLVLIAVGFALVLAMTLLVFATRPQKFSITPEGVNNSAANEQRKLSIARLKRLMEEQDELISRKQADLTKLEAAFVSLDDPHSNVHGLRAPTGADIDRMIEHLAELTKAERRKALMSARPAPTVRALYEQLQATEQKLSTRLEEVSKDDS